MVKPDWDAEDYYRDLRERDYYENEYDEWSERQEKIDVLSYQLNRICRNICWDFMLQRSRWSVAGIGRGTYTYAFIYQTDGSQRDITVPIDVSDPCDMVGEIANAEGKDWLEIGEELLDYEYEQAHTRDT